MRTIIEGDGFANNRGKIHADPAVVDEILESLVWALARNPMIGQRVDRAAPLWGIRTHAWFPKRVPSLLIFYLFDDKTVTLVGLYWDKKFLKEAE